MGLTGEIATTSQDGKRITGGQVMQLCELIETFRVPRVTIETNGIGTFAPAFLKMALKQWAWKDRGQVKNGLVCGVAEVDAIANKNGRILEALEPVLTSGMLWAHTSVLDGDLWDQMKDWKPMVRKQPDDLLDAGAGAVTDQPARIGKSVRNVEPDRPDDWRRGMGTYEVELTRD